MNVDTLEPRSRSRRLASRRRDLVWGGASAVVVLLVLGMVFGGWSSPALAMTVTSSRSPGADVGEVVYGNVTGGGRRMTEGMTVIASHRESRHLVIDAVAPLDRDGTYRVVLGRRRGSESVTIAGTRGRPSGTVSFRIRPGIAYRVSARFVPHLAFFFFPIFSY